MYKVCFNPRTDLVTAGRTVLGSSMHMCEGLWSHVCPVQEPAQRPACPEPRGVPSHPDEPSFSEEPGNTCLSPGVPGAHKES